jgi:hypothetical protein
MQLTLEELAQVRQSSHGIREILTTDFPDATIYILRGCSRGKAWTHAAYFHYGAAENMRNQINTNMHHIVEATVAQLNRGKVYDPRAKGNIKGDKERNRIYGCLYSDLRKGYNWPKETPKANVVIFA